MPRPIQPTFSHGGSGVEGWPPIAGTGVGKGNPIEVYPGTGLNWPRIQLSHHSGADMTVLTQINPGPIDELTGIPNENHWLTIGTDVFAGASSNKSYSMPPDAMYVRTWITVYAAGTLESMVPALELPTGQKVSAQYPTLKKGGPV